MQNAPIKNDYPEIHTLLKKELRGTDTKLPQIIQSRLFVAAVEMTLCIKALKDGIEDQATLIDAVEKDMDERYEIGKSKYGVGLQPFNGRDSLQDAYEEFMDAVYYIRQNIYEQENKNENLTA